MAFESIVYRILIASPSDVYEEREIAARVIQEWNDLHSFNKKIVLLPLRWETHTTPTFGERPQEIINKQIVDECDFVLGFFWSRIGSPTGKEISGTIEEIKRAAKNGKPVMLYFSKRGMDPSEIEIDQLISLNEFKTEIYNSALIENYSSLVEFRDKLSRQLEIKIREFKDISNSTESIKFLLLSSKTGEVLPNGETFNINRVTLSTSEITEIAKSHDVLMVWKLKSELYSVQSMNNNIPIVLGIKNSDNRIYHNTNVELKIICDIPDALEVMAIDSKEINITDKVNDYPFYPEERSQLIKIYTSNVNKVNDKKWDIQIPPFTVLPTKTKAIEPLIVLYPTGN